MLGLLTGVATGLGAITGGMSSWYEQSEARKQAKQYNEQVNTQLRDIKDQREQSTQRQSMTSGDFLNQYAMIRDPQKSQGIQQMYQQNVQVGQQERNRFDERSSQLELSKQTVPSKPNWETGLAGAFGGASTGFSFGAGLESQQDALKKKKPLV